MGGWRREERGKGRGLLCRCTLPKKSLSTSIQVPCLQATPIITTTPPTCFLLIPRTTHQRPIPKDLARQTPKFLVKNKAARCLISSLHLVHLLKPAKTLLLRRPARPCSISRPTSPLWRAGPLEPGRDRWLAHLWAQPMPPSADEFRPSGSTWIPGTGRALSGVPSSGLRKGGTPVRGSSLAQKRTPAELCGLCHQRLPPQTHSFTSLSVQLQPRVSWVPRQSLSYFTSLPIWGLAQSP